MFMWLWNPGQMVCAYFGITGEHRMIARTLINTHWYGHGRLSGLVFCGFVGLPYSPLLAA